MWGSGRSSCGWRAATCAARSATRRSRSPRRRMARVQTSPGADAEARLPNPVSFDDLLDALRRLDDPPGLHAAVSITGGEPLLHPHAVLALAVGARALGCACTSRRAGTGPAPSPTCSRRWTRSRPTSSCKRHRPAHALGRPRRDLPPARRGRQGAGGEGRRGRHHARRPRCARPRPSPPSACPACPSSSSRPRTSPAGRPCRGVAHLFRLHAAAGMAHPDVRVIPQVHRMLRVR